MVKNGIIHQKNMKYTLATCNGFFIIIFYNNFSNNIKLIYIQLKIKYYIKEYMEASKDLDLKTKMLQTSSAGIDKTVKEEKHQDAKNTNL